MIMAGTRLSRWFPPSGASCPVVKGFQLKKTRFLHEWARHARSRGHPVWILLRIAARIFLTKHKQNLSPKIFAYLEAPD